MLEHDVQLLDRAGLPLASYGPRKIEEGDEKHAVSCAPDEAQFWGVYFHPDGDARAEHVLDAHDAESAKTAAELLKETQVVGEM